MGVEELERALEQLAGQGSVPQDEIDLYGEIFQAQSRAKREISGKAPRLARKKLEERLEQGQPLLSPEKVKIPLKGLEDLFKDICSALRKHDRESGPEVQVLEEARVKGKVNLAELARSAALGEGKYCRDTGEKLMLRHELLLFLGLSLARPLFELWAENLRNRVKDDRWLRPYCPICGSEPYIAKLHREDGRRILGCPLCGTEWTFKRAECPFCLNKDQKSLRYFFVDQDSPYRVDVCDVCKRYIKTVDERKTDAAGTVLLVEDIATAYLDIVAEREGYVRAEQGAAA